MSQIKVQRSEASPGEPAIHQKVPRLCGVNPGEPTNTGHRLTVDPESKGCSPEDICDHLWPSV